MTTADKCEQIVRRILDLANQQKTVGFEDDWGGNSVTLFEDGVHTHVGAPAMSWPEFVDALHAQLCHGRGLSFVGKAAS